ncbi:MAG TPA: histidine phosphatase family protein [Ktedonobacterales bacterium]
MTHLYLIRHGEAVCNVDRDAPTAGMKGDLGLTPLGKLQAERLRDRLTATGEIAADVFIASTLLRARQTAEIVAPAVGLPITWDDDVQELRVGEIDGVPWRKIADTVPDFRKEPFRPLSAGGENWPRFVLRVATALERITREHEGKTIVVVCHGGVIDSSFVIFSGMSSLVFPTLDLATRNTSITHWERHEDHGAPRWRLHKYNDDLHVRDIGAEERVHWPLQRERATGGAEGTAVPLPTEEG